MAKREIPTIDAGEAPSELLRELVAHLRRESRYASIPILVISGDADPDTPRRALSVGADAFFAKPYSPGAVRQKLEELIYGR